MLLQQVTHGAIQFTAYEELRKAVVEFRSADSEEDSSAVELLVTLYFYYLINFDTNSKYSFFFFPYKNSEFSCAHCNSLLHIR